VTFGGLLQAAALLTVVVSVLTAFDTRQHFVELFSHFRLQYLVVSLLLLILLALRRQALYSLLLALAVALNASYVLPWYAGSEAAAASGELKVLYTNVLASNREHDRLLALLRHEQPDIVALLEISAQWLGALQVLEEDFPHSYTVPREDNFGMGVWSRLPLSAATHIDSPPLGYPTILARINVDGATVRLIATHPMIPVGADNFAARNQQLQSIEDMVSATDDNVILIGDLNASIWDRHYRDFEDATGLRNARRGYGILPTWPTFMPPAMIPIDHVLVSDRIGITDIRTGPRIGSDHLPLVVTVAL
jgi:endonuclease/exonuclease/phosphatase (EEP) superfamily protein YafD